MVLFQFVHEFLSPAEEGGAKTTKKSGKTNRKFFIIVACHQVAHLLIQFGSIIAILVSILQDEEYNHNVINGKLHFLERNADDLNDIFGKEEVWRRKLSRFSKEQVYFFISSIATAALYAINLSHFFLYKNFRVRVIWTGVFHCLMLCAKCYLIYNIFATYFKVHSELAGISKSLEVYYHTPQVILRGSLVDSVNSLMVKGQPIYTYCFKGEPPEELLHHIQDNYVCPADREKLFVIVLSVIDALLIAGCVLIVAMWHHAVEEVEEYADVPKHLHESDSSSSSASSVPELGSPDISDSSIVSYLGPHDARGSNDIDPDGDGAGKRQRRSTGRKSRLDIMPPRRSGGMEVKFGGQKTGLVSQSVDDLRHTLHIPRPSP